MRFTYAHIENASWQRNFYNLSFKAEYKLNRWRIQVQGSNILYLRNLEWATTASTPYYISSAVYRKMPGYLTLGVVYRF